MNLSPDILSFAQSAHRNAIVFCHTKINGLSFVDVGHELAQLLAERDDLADAQECLTRVLSRSAEAPGIGRYLAITNIGILFEPDLKLNLRNLLDNYGSADIGGWWDLSSHE